MGVAGAAMLGIIFFLFKSIISAINFFIWKRKINATGIVKELKEKKNNYTDNGKISSIEYIYVIDYEYNGDKHSVEYIEKVSGDRPSELILNSSLPIFVDIDENIAKSVIDLKSQIKIGLLGLVFCVIVLLFCMFIFIGLNNS